MITDEQRYELAAALEWLKREADLQPTIAPYADLILGGAILLLQEDSVENPIEVLKAQHDGLQKTVAEAMAKKFPNG